jgi:hypothetical protein
MLATGPKAAGLNLAEDNGFLWVIKSIACASIGGEVKLLVPCSRFMAFKRTLLYITA